MFVLESLSIYDLLDVFMILARFFNTLKGIVHWQFLNSGSATMKNQLPNGPGVTSVHPPPMWDGLNHRVFPIYEVIQ